MTPDDLDNFLTGLPLFDVERRTLTATLINALRDAPQKTFRFLAFIFLDTLFDEFPVQISLVFDHV